VAEEMALQQHLRSCTTCQQTAAAFARQTSMLRSLPLVSPPSTLRQQVLGGIQRQTQPPRRFVFSPRWLAAPLSAGLVILLVAIGLQRMHQGTSSAQPNAPATLKSTSNSGAQPDSRRSLHAGKLSFGRSTQRKSAQSGAPSPPFITVLPTQPVVTPPVVSQQLPVGHKTVTNGTRPRATRTAVPARGAAHGTSRAGSVAAAPTVTPSTLFTLTPAISAPTATATPFAAAAAARPPDSTPALATPTPSVAGPASPEPATPSPVPTPTSP
jgi:hypothetical protein